jgi:hypothetical protein
MESAKRKCMFNFICVEFEKIKYILMLRCQKAGQRQSIKIANRSFEDVVKFKYLRTTVTSKLCS